MRKHPDARCEDCSLVNRPFVPDKFGRENELMFVGEAPGKADLKNKEPLTGASGQLLMEVLDIYDIDRRDVYITNTIACVLRDGEKVNKNDVACCAPRLHSIIKDIRPKTIVPLGATATQAVLETKEGVKSLRIGPPKNYGRVEGIKVIPTVAPGYVIKKADEFPNLLRDLGKIVDTSNVRAWQPPNWSVVDDNSENTLRAIRNIYQSHNAVVIDIEVGVEKDEQGTHPERYDFLCVGIGYGNNNVLVIGEQALKFPEVQREFTTLLETCNLICHNGKFDIAALRRFTPKVTLFADTMLASYCLDERTGVHSLGFLSREILGAPDWKDVTKEFTKGGKSYANIPRPILYQYNAYDVGCTLLLWHYFAGKMSAELRSLHNFLVRSAMALMELELDGMIVDTDYLNQLDAELQEEGERYEAVLHIKYGVANPRSWQQVQKYLRDQGVNVSSTDEAHLTQIYADRMKMTVQAAVMRLEMPIREMFYTDPVCEFIHLLLEYRGLAKLWGTYVNGIGERLYNGRIYPNLSLHTTVTGRLSSKDPNMQNVPRGGTIKRLFIPAPGYTYVQCDYRAAELRVVGCLSRCGYLRDVLNDLSRDIHGEVAARWYGPKYTKEQRTNCKRVVFGSTYGAEASRVSEILGVSVLEARQFLDSFFELMPEVVEWRDDLKRRILHGEDLVTYKGRRRRNRLITNLNKKDIVKEGWAMIPQSTSSDICLTAANTMRLDYGLKTRMLVHDSILVECPTEDAEDVMNLMQKIMTDTAREDFDDYITFTTEGEMGQSWAMT